MPAKLTQETFIARATAAHGGYDYSQTVYTIASEKVTIICPKHGPFEQIADAHMRGHGCKACADDVAGKDKIVDLRGQVFGMLTVLRREHDGIRMQWLCRCECGAEKIVQGGHLRSGSTNSCGCNKDTAIGDAHRRHGKSGKPGSSAYHTWYAMLQRCRYEKKDNYAAYGGAGITVCEEWGEFEKFYADMGDKPQGTSLDRIDGTKGYYKDNCRWATFREQANNRKNNRKLTAFGETLNLSEWAIRLGMSMSAISDRLTRGWSVEDAVSLPPCKPGVKRISGQ